MIPTSSSTQFLFAASMLLGLSLLSSAQEKRQVSYQVAPKAIVTIRNSYGPIEVKAGPAGQVVVTSSAHSKAVNFQNEQHGNRIELHAVSASPGTELAEYLVLLPADSWVTMKSTGGSLRADGLQGDITMEAMTGPIVVANVSGAHLHLQTLEGAITLTGISRSQLDVNSLRGNISLKDVKGSQASVRSGSGVISYEGDPGADGEYSLTTHTGNLEISIPATTAVDIRQRSLTGHFNALDLAGSSAFLARAPRRSVGAARAGSSFILRSIRGKIEIKRP